MALRTADQYRAGLVDDRRVFYRGAQITSVLDDPELRMAVDHSAGCFDMSFDRPD
ncbi:MAG: 4-hydroxybutyryl-CoA dehydratase/vinylacetyl-CoA-Delta-isomerase, partial [Aeromicrobium sp.]|nr:4-hydroxybutyryl-CoA dehydratase/vinylacetyl-CoA-Delta-isomerase [Aeromicrobium sp.]